MEDIVDKSKKYKIYLIILGVAAIISLVISYFMYLALIQQKEAIDETYEKIVNSGDETSKEVQEIAQELSNQNGSFRTLETVYNIAATVNKESNTLTFDDILDAIKQMRFEEGNIRKAKIGFNS